MPPQIHVKSREEERTTFLPNSSHNISIPSTKSSPLKLDTSQESNHHLGHSETPLHSENKRNCCRVCSFRSLSYLLVLLLGFFIGTCIYNKSGWFTRPVDSGFNDIPSYDITESPGQTLGHKIGDVLSKINGQIKANSIDSGIEIAQIQVNDTDVELLF